MNHYHLHLILKPTARLAVDQLHNPKLHLLALLRPPAIIKVVKVPAPALPPARAATKCNRPVRTRREACGVDGARLRRLVKLELVVGRNVAGSALAVEEDAVVESERECVGRLAGGSSTAGCARGAARLRLTVADLSHGRLVLNLTIADLGHRWDFILHLTVADLRDWVLDLAIADLLDRATAGLNLAVGDLGNSAAGLDLAIRNLADSATRLGLAIGDLVDSCLAVSALLGSALCSSLVDGNAKHAIVGWQTACWCWRRRSNGCCDALGNGVGESNACQGEKGKVSHVCLNDMKIGGKCDRE